MASNNFFLKNSKDKKKKSIIYIQINYKVGGEHKKIKFSTGEKIYPKEWKQSKQKSIYPEINTELEKLYRKADRIIRKAKNENIELNNEYIKQEWSKPDVEEQKKIFDYQEVKDEYLKSEKAVRTSGTMKQKESSLKHVDDFSEKMNIRLTFENINLAFYDKLMSYCYNEAGLHTGATGNVIKNLKAFLNWATDRGYNTNLEFRKRAFKKPTSEPDILYLNEAELFQFFNAEITDKKHSHVRDIFCFGCFTGLRFSDIKNLSKSNLIEKEVTINDVKEKLTFIEFRVKKTKAIISQPLNHFAQAILDEHNSEYEFCFKMYSEQKTNEYLKKAASEAKLTRKVKKTKFKGAEQTSEVMALHEAITFHMSKKTFMTNFLAKGGSLQTAMAFTGNKDYATAKRYFKVVDDLKAAEMMKVFSD